MKSIHDSITSDENAELTNNNIAYNLGDGSLATFKINNLGISSGAYIRDYNNKHNIYYLYLKYSSHDYLTTGAYIQIDAAAGKSIYKATLNGLKEDGLGVQIQTLNMKTGLYEIERTTTLTKSAASFTFEKDTSSVRIYQCNTTEGTYKYLQIKDGFSANINDSSFKTLKFDSKGGTSINSVGYYPNEVTEEPIVPTRANEGTTKYTFEGWYTDTNCTEGNEFTFGETLAANTTLFAKWSESTVTGVQLTFVTNSSSVIDSQTVEFGETFTAPSQVPTKSSDQKYDYIFENWYTDSEFTTLFDFSTAYTNDVVAYAKYSYKLNTIPGASNFSIKNNIKTYGASWSTTMFEEHDILSSDISESMVDSIISFKNAYGNGYGIKRAGVDKYDVYMRKCIVIWKLNDYSKFISTVRWDIKNTGYGNNYGHPEYIINLYANETGTGEVIDSECVAQSSTEKDRAVQMTNNLDETINAVSFKQVNESFNYGFEKLQYILGDASAAQQIKNFAKDFLDTLTCSGEGSITAESGSWDIISARVNKMSSEAKTMLQSYSGNDTDVINALERYDYIISKYGSASYANFLDRSINPISASSLFSLTKINESSDIYLIIISLSLVGLSAIGCYYFVKRRKENY